MHLEIIADCAVAHCTAEEYDAFLASFTLAPPIEHLRGDFVSRRWTWDFKRDRRCEDLFREVDAPPHVTSLRYVEEAYVADMWRHLRRDRVEQN